MKHILSYFINEDEKPKSGPSDKWKANCIRLLKKGKTLNDESLSNMGKNDIIVKYFPMADPKYIPKNNDIAKYLLKNPDVKTKIITSANKKLVEHDNTVVANSRYSKHMGTALKIDLGYLNVKYKVTLKKVRLTGFDNKKFKGRAHFNIWAYIPDGILKGTKVNINASLVFTSNYSGKITKEDVVATFKPSSAILNTNKFSVSGSAILNTALATAALAMPAAWILFKIKFFVSNNVLKVFWGKILGLNLGTSSIYTLKPLSYIRKAMGPEVNFSIPKNDLRIAAVPDTPAQVKKMVSKIKVG